jgi:hypothetical protein
MLFEHLKWQIANRGEQEASSMKSYLRFQMSNEDANLRRSTPIKHIVYLRFQMSNEDANLQRSTPIKHIVYW